MAAVIKYATTTVLDFHIVAVILATRRPVQLVPQSTIVSSTMAGASKTASILNRASQAARATQDTQCRSQAAFRSTTATRTTEVACRYVTLMARPRRIARATVATQPRGYSAMP